MSPIDRILTDSDEQQIVEAIRGAEKNTSGEIRVHFEKITEKPPFDRAKEVFYLLKMNETKLQNGILIYVAYESKKIAILGDKGIHDVTGDHFWSAEKDLLIQYFKEEKYAEGLIKVIGRVGEKLKTFFPHQSDDVNELSDEISRG